MISLFQISLRMWRWKNFEIRPALDEVMCRVPWLYFFGLPCIHVVLCLILVRYTLVSHFLVYGTVTPVFQHIKKGAKHKLLQIGLSKFIFGRDFGKTVPFFSFHRSSSRNEIFSFLWQWGITFGTPVKFGTLMVPHTSTLLARVARLACRWFNFSFCFASW